MLNTGLNTGLNIVRRERIDMTTATTVAGRPLSGWSRDTRFGTWHALLPDPPGEPVLGALRIDPALLGPEGTRERLAAVVLATAKLRLPGLLGTVDLVAEAGEVWLLTARPPAPVLADVLSADGPRPDAGSVASVLNETAQTLLALHTAGLTHGSLDPDTVVLAPDGVALLTEAGLGSVLGDAPRADRQAADIAAWAALARTLGTAWAQAGTPAADLFAHCSATAESEGLAAARAALVAGRAALPADFLRRTALRAAVAASTPEFTQGQSDQGPTAPADRAEAAPERPAPPEDRRPAPTTAAPTEHPTERPAAAPAPGTAAPDQRAAAHSSAAADQLTTPGRAQRAAPDAQATVLGKRNRVTSPTAPAGEDSGEILLRFGPGVPVDEQDALCAQWRTEAAVPAQQRPRRRRRGWIITTAVVATAAILLWLLLRPGSAPAVVAVQVQAPAGTLHCGQTADMVGVVTTDGHGGPVTYQWLRGDGQTSGELVRTAHRGERRLTVHLRWTVRGPGRFRGTARLLIAHQRSPREAKATFSYACP
ncbi:hypothetical protein ABZ865_08790 [Streptomyces sp. NPDC047085]|uniref:hypothetical protein n=1 Tax=Streptomyces sp. NPDC047085 TaxID=3155140 RepID=UPI003407EDA3